MAGGVTPASAVAAGRRRKPRRRHTPMAEINVTPFVDVMLVLLIVFMVSAPLLTVGVPVDLPAARGEQLGTDKEPLSITINADGDILLQEAVVTEDELFASVRGIIEGEPDKRVLIRGYRHADYGAIAVVLSRIKEAGATKITLQTKAIEEAGS
jgi:biopolymer transport protein TolR